MIPEPQGSAEQRREAGLDPPQPAGERWRHFFGLLATFWAGKDWLFAWTGTAILLASELGGVYISVWTNAWQRRLFDAVQFKQIAVFGTLVVSFCVAMAVNIVASLVSQYLYSMLAFRWRRALTDRFLTRWLARNRYYEIERTRLIDNPDQRIAEDLNLLPSGTLSLVFGFITSSISLFAYALIILKTSEAIHLSIFGWRADIPGDMLWYTSAYALVGAYLIVLAGRPLVRRTMRQQHYEANFRFGLIHVRRNAEQIALARAVPTEDLSLRTAFGNIRRNFVRLVYAQLGVRATQDLYGRVGEVLPLFLMLPKYFADKLTFGQVMGGRDAFSRMLAQLSFFSQAYPSIAEQIANANRIKALDDALDPRRPRGIALTTGTGDRLIANDLSINTPDGRQLVDIGDWVITPGERWVVRGPSGSGKSTLMRVIAGLWPDGRGEVQLPLDKITMFVPQRLYLPLGTLKDAVCFPDRAGDHDDAAIGALLTRVGLGAHVDHMHALRTWQDDLSPGEQQRIALARILLQKPDRLVLDEATSSLDADNSQTFYRTIVEEFPHITLISVVHDESLVRFHDREMMIVDGVGRQK